jgi:hypothetical protein
VIIIKGLNKTDTLYKSLKIMETKDTKGMGSLRRRERLSKVDLLIKIGCFVKKKNKISVEKAAEIKC